MSFLPYKPSLTVIALAMVILGPGCKEQTPDVNPPVAECIGNEPVDNTDLLSCSLPSPDSAWCELIEIDQAFMLSEEAKEWLPQYCLEEGSDVVFLNGSGDRMNFLVSKGHSISVVGHNGFDECIQDSSRSYWYCARSESAIVLFAGANPDITFSIAVTKEIERPVQMDYRLGDALVVSMFREGQLLSYEQLLHLIVVRGDLDDNPSPSNLEYYESLALNGKVFRDVYSMNFPEPFTKDYKVYYNLADGLLAFEDPDKVTWVIE